MWTVIGLFILFYFVLVTIVVISAGGTPDDCEIKVNDLRKNIIIINGTGRSGKDTFCDYVGDKYVVKTISSARIPKQIAIEYFGWNGEKTEKDRKMLSDLKDIATEYKDIPFLDMCDEIEKFKKSKDEHFLFIHIREPQEIKKMICKHPEIKTLLISNPEIKDITSNHADANVKNYEYDYVINNDGTLDELKNKAILFADKLYMESL